MCLRNASVLSKPEGQFCFGDLTGGQTQKSEASVLLAGIHGVAVELKEDECNLHGRSLISVDEWVIAGKAKRVRGR